MQFGRTAELRDRAPMNGLEKGLYNQVMRASRIASRVFRGARKYPLVERECFRLCTADDLRIGLVSPLAQVIFVYDPAMLPHAETLAEQYRRGTKKEFTIVKEYESV